MSIPININSQGDFPGYSVRNNLVQFTTNAGTYSINESGGSVNSLLTIKFTQTDSSINIINTTFNRQLQISSTLPSGHPTITFTNITSRSIADPDIYNIYNDGNSRSRIYFKDSTIYAYPNNIPVGGSPIIWTNSYINFDTSGEYNMGAIESNALLSCTINMGSASSDIELLLGELNEKNILNANIIGNVKITASTFFRRIAVKVKTGNILDFDSCIFKEYTNPQFSNTNINMWSGDYSLISLIGDTDYTGDIRFSNSYLYPRVWQSNMEGDHKIISFSQNQNWNNIIGTSTIHHLAHIYDAYNTIYSDSSFIKNSIINLDIGHYQFGTRSNPVAFTLNFQLDDPISENPTIEVYTNNGNINYTNVSTRSVLWSGIIIGREDAVDPVFKGANVLDFNGIKITAHAGNNIIDASAVQGTLAGTNIFSYYPSSNPYNLMNDNPIVTQNPIQLYHGWAYSAPAPIYKFYASTDLRPEFTFCRDVSYTLSTNTINPERQFIRFVDSSFGSGITLNMHTDVSLSPRVWFDGCSIDVSGDSCIEVLADSSGYININNSSSSYGAHGNDFYLLSDSDNIVKLNGSATVISTSATTSPNIYHLLSGTWDWTNNFGTWLESHDINSQLSISGSYAFSSLPDNRGLVFNCLSTTQIHDTIIPQTITLKGPASPVSFQRVKFIPNPNTSLTGNEYVNRENMQGDINLTDVDFYIPAGKTCIYPYTNVNLTNVASILISSDIYAELEPLTYSLNKFYTDASRTVNINIQSIDKPFTIGAWTSSTNENANDISVSISGQFKKITLDPTNRTDGFSISEIHFNNAVLDGSNYDTGLVLLPGNTDVIIDNTSITAGSDSYIKLMYNYSGKLTLNNNNALTYLVTQPKYVINSRSTGVIDLTDLVLPVPLYNYVFWSNLSLNPYSSPFISNAGYVAESWTNNTEYYSTVDSDMYFVNNVEGITKYNNNYGTGAWTAPAGMQSISFIMAYGYPDASGTATITMDISNGYANYSMGGLDDGEVGVATKVISSKNFNIKYNTSNIDTMLYSGDITTTFSVNSGKLWNDLSGYGPVSLKYYIDNQVSADIYTLTAQVYNNQWLDVNNASINLSDSQGNGSGNIRFLYKKNDNVNRNLNFNNDTSLSFTTDTSYVIITNTTEIISEYILSWPANNITSNYMSIKTNPNNNFWTSNNIIAHHMQTDVSFNVNNIDDDHMLVVNKSNTNMMANNTLSEDVSVSYHPLADNYTFDTSFYILTHVLPISGIMDLSVNGFIRGTNAPVIVQMTVSGEEGMVLTQADVPICVNLVITIPNNPNIYCNETYQIELDIRGVEGLITVPAYLYFMLTIPTLLYFSLDGNRTDQNLNANIIKSNTVQNMLYVYLNSVYSNTNSYAINIDLTGGNISQSIEVVIYSGQVIGQGQFYILEDNKIWGDAQLFLNSDRTIENTLTYNYVETATHGIIFNIGRAIVNGSESVVDLSGSSYMIDPVVGNEHLNQPLWKPDADVPVVAEVPITKYTPYFVSVRENSIAYYTTGPNAGINNIAYPKVRLSFKDQSGNDILDYYISHTLDRVDGEGSDRLLYDDRNIYFRFKPSTDFKGDYVQVYVSFIDIEDSNYQNLTDIYHLANISFTGESNAVAISTSGLILNNWMILPSGDGRTLGFYSEMDGAPVFTIQKSA